MAKKATSWLVNGDGGNTARQVRDVLADVGKMHERLHIVARNAMIQVLVHKQSTPLVTLMQGLSGTSVHVLGLRLWCEKHGRGIKFTLKGDTIAIVYPKDFETMTLDAALEWATLVPHFWIENKPPSAFKGFNYAAEKAKLEATAQKMWEAKRDGTLKKGKEIVELSDDDIKAIDLTGWHGADIGPVGATMTIN